MTKEFEQIREAVANKQQELDIISRNRSLEEERKKDEATKIRMQEAEESKVRSNENKRIFESVGIIKLFEELRDSGIVRAENTPVYEQTPVYKQRIFGGEKQIGTKKTKISDFTPAKIVYGTENKSISLIFNIRSGFIDRYQTYYYDDRITFSITDDKKISLNEYNDDTKKTEIKVIENLTEIPQIIADKITKKMN